MIRTTKASLWLASAAGLLVLGATLTLLLRSSPETMAVTAYMTPECGCCGDWVAHMEENGFLVTTRYLSFEELERLKDRFGVPPATRSCHTAEVGGMVVEGHVPADIIRRAIAAESELVGLAVPGMPLGSPGMEVPGGRSDPYDIVGFDRHGEVTIVERR